MTTFVLAHFTIHDRAGYDRYVALATPIFMREGVKILANDEAPIAMTPNMKADKIVLLEFRDDAHMQAFFALPDYVAAAEHRNSASTLSAVKFDRFVP
jgi:uncharacterized protein (DUF1330 family)